METSNDQNFAGTFGKKEVIWTEQEGKNSFIIQLSRRWKQFAVRRKIFFPYLCKRIGETIADLVEEATLTQEDINEILKQLEQKQPVDTIECNCIPGQCECKQHQ